MLFSFEDDGLEFIPLDVRRKLDLAGVKLSLSAWQRLSFEERRALVEAKESWAPRGLARGGGERITVGYPRRGGDSLLAAEEAARAIGIAINRTALDDRGRYALCYYASRDEERFRAVIAELGVAY